MKPVEEGICIIALTLALHKPKIREGTRRIGVELDWRERIMKRCCEHTPARRLWWLRVER